MNLDKHDEGIIEKTRGIQLDDIELSTRLRNCLKRGGYYTLTEIMLESPEKLSAIRNLGSVSEGELFALRQFVNDSDRTAIEQLCVNKGMGSNQRVVDEESDWNLLEVAIGRKIGSSIIVFLSDDGDMHDDIYINELNLSKRTLNVLSYMSIDSLKKAAFLLYRKVAEVKGFGQKSINELLDEIRKRAVITELVVTDISAFDSVLNAIYDFFQPIIDKSDLSSKRDEIISVIVRLFGEDVDLNALDENSFIQIAKFNPIHSFIRHILISTVSEKIYYGIERATVVSLVSDQNPVFISILNNTIDQMITDKHLRMINGKLYHYKAFLEEWIATLDGNSKIALECRCKGMTLEETGLRLDVTRERVRQIVAKAIQRKPPLYEDDYAVFLEKYYLTKEEICGLFCLDEMQANYLLFLYKRGSKDIQDLLDDSSVPGYIKDRVGTVMKGKVIIIDGDCIPLKRDALLKQLLKTFYADSECSVEEFESFYLNFLNENHLSGYEHLLFPNTRAFEARVTDYSFTIAKAGHKIRYYDTTAVDINKLLEDVDISSYDDMEISTLKLVRDFPEVMEQYDIRDEYELHNLIRKRHSDIENYEIVVTRMPFICIGDGDRNRQVEELLYQMAPIANTDLAIEYEKRYGVRPETVLANFFKCIDVFYHDGIFDIEQQELSADDYELLREELKEDFYLWDTLIKIYLDKSNDPKPDAINAMTLKKLGFKVYSQYVISSRFPSADAYFNSLLLENEELLLYDLPHGLRTIQAYYAVLTELRDELELIEVRKDIFYRFDYFKGTFSIGTKDDLYNLSKVVSSRIAGQDYFSVEAIAASDMVEDLPYFLRNPFILNSLLRVQPTIKTGRIENTYIGTKKENELSQLGVITNLIQTDGEMSLAELSDNLREKYYLNLDRSRIIYVLDGSVDLAYDELYDYVYLANNMASREDEYLTNGRMSHVIMDNYEAIINSSASISMIYWKDKYLSFVEYCADKQLFEMRDILKLNIRELYNNASKLNISRGAISEIITQYLEWVVNITNDNAIDQEEGLLDLFFK